MYFVNRVLGHLTCNRLLRIYRRSDRLLSLPVGFTLIRHRYLRATLLLCFLLLHAPGYGLHAIVGIEHDAQLTASGCCEFCELEKLDSEPESSDEQSTEESECCVCKLLATLATTDVGVSMDSSAPAVHGIQVHRVTACVTSKSSNFARGPPQS